jgi:hypothetical protein
MGRGIRQMRFGCRVMLRTALTLSVLIIYCACFNQYIYELTRAYWDEHYIKLFYNYITLGMLLFYLWDRQGKFAGFFHAQFNKVCISCVIINYIIIIFNRHGFIGDAEKMFRCFNWAVVATTIMFLTNGIWLKVFKYEH